MAKTNIFSEDWCKLVFDARFTGYGAFQMRKDSSNRHRNALIITIIFFLSIFFVPRLISTIIPERKELNV